MREPAFTPGPWQTSDYAEGSEFEVLDSNGGYIAGVAFEPENGRMHAAARQDARLIAAAPALYEALTRAREVLIDFNGYSTNGPLIQEIDAALSLALGESPNA